MRCTQCVVPGVRIPHFPQAESSGNRLMRKEQRCQSLLFFCRQQIALRACLHKRTSTYKKENCQVFFFITRLLEFFVCKDAPGKVWAFEVASLAQRTRSVPSNPSPLPSNPSPLSSPISHLQVISRLLIGDQQVILILLLMFHLSIVQFSHAQILV